MAAPKVNFGPDRQQAVVGYLRQCADAKLPPVGPGTSQSVTKALAGDAVIDVQKSDCLRVGAAHIESVQQHYGDNK